MTQSGHTGLSFPLPARWLGLLRSLQPKGEVMKRREFIKALGVVGVVASATVVRGQQSAVPLIGFLSSRSPGESASLVEAFRQGLRETGFIEGQNIAIAFRWAEGRY